MSRDFHHAYIAVSRRWPRNVRSIIAVAIGAATVFVAVALTQTSAHQLAQRLAEFDARTITAVLPGDAWRSSEEDVLGRLANDANIRAAGTFIPPESGSSHQLWNPLGDIEATASLIVATNEGMEARGVSIEQGARLPAPLVLREHPYSVLIGTRLARELNIDLGAGRTQLVLDGIPMTVTGVVVDNVDSSAVTTAVVMHPETAAALDLLPEGRSLLIDLDDADVEAVASYLPVALRASSPDSVRISFEPSPARLTESLLANSAGLVNLLTAIMTVVTAFSIMTTMGIAIMERRREIGVARALGTRRAEIGRRFLLEAAFLGAVGSVIGFLAGTLICAVASAWLGWGFVLPTALLLLPLAGTLVGAASGAWPALQATRVDPAELLRA